MTTAPSPPPDEPVAPPGRILEASLYVADVGRARRFYEDVLGLSVLFADDRLVACDVGGASVLLLFAHDAGDVAVTLPGGTIPPHAARGRIHVAFAIAAEAEASWRRRLAARGVAIEGETAWPRGGRSLYFRDPDDHLVELATPGIWAIY